MSAEDYSTGPSAAPPGSAPPPGDAAEGDVIELTLTVDDMHDGCRLDRFLSDRITRLSRNRIRAIIEGGQVRLEDAVPRPSTRVRAGQNLRLRRPAPVEPPAVLDYRVVHQDDQVLVVDKPAGLPVHPSARYHRHTLTAVMRDRLGPDHGWQMAHRLDRETSGVLIFGQTGPAASALKRAFALRDVDKTYLALVRGEVAEPLAIDVPLGPAQGSAVRIKIGPRALDDGGQVARTDVEPLRVGVFNREPATLVRAFPRTGRQHQIRVHLAHVGHPIVGDKLYGIDERWFIEVTEQGRPVDELEAELGLHRQALHAESLQLPHPRDGARVTFTAPWPEELAAVFPAACDGSPP